MNKHGNSSDKGKRIWITVIASLILVILVIVGCLMYYGMDRSLAKAKQAGSEYLLDENYGKAAEEYKKAVELAPEDPVNYFQLAEAYIGLGDYEDAVLYLTQALGIVEQKKNLNSMEQYISICIKLAQCYRMAGNEAMREEVLKQGYEFSRSKRINDLLSVKTSVESGTDITEEEISTNQQDTSEEASQADSDDGEEISGQDTSGEDSQADSDNGEDIDGQDTSGEDSLADSDDDREVISEQDSLEEASQADTDNSDIGDNDQYETDNKEADADENGKIIWADRNVETEVRKALGKDNGAITIDEAGEYAGALDISKTEVTTLVDLIWFKDMSVLVCRGKDITAAELINRLQADRVIAIYNNMEEVQAIDNTEVLKEIKHLGIQVSNFSLGDMSIAEMLGFYSSMNQIMSGLTNLEYLDLSDNGLTDISLLAGISNIKNIRYLILKNNDISDISILKDFKELIYLDIMNNDITDFSPVEHVDTVVGK